MKILMKLVKIKVLKIMRLILQIAKQEEKANFLNNKVQIKLSITRNNTIFRSINLKILDKAHKHYNQKKKKNQHLNYFKNKPS